MKKKIGTILICFLLSSIILLVANNEFDVDAAGGGETGDGGDNGIGLDMDYMFQVTLDLAGVIHNDSIWGDNIRKGRDFGSAGDQWTAEYLFREMNDLAPTLENVEKIQIQKDNDTGYLWPYNEIIDVVDFKLTINGSQYSYSQIMPKNETYPRPTGVPNRVPGTSGFLRMDYTHQLNDLIIVPRDLRKYFDYTISYINVSCNETTAIADSIGNATFIPINGGIPEDQECRVFLLEEEEGVNSQLENITDNTSAVILIHNDSREQKYYADTANYTNLSIGRVIKSDSNLSLVVDLLKNGTLMIADNDLHGNDTFTFNYNFEFTLFPWGDEDFLFVSPHNPYMYSEQQYLNIRIISIRNFREKYFPGGSGVVCHGVIAYDIDDDTHLMWPPRRHWAGWTNSGNLGEEIIEWGWKWPHLQCFFVNQSVGHCLENISDEPDTEVSGYFEQEEKNVLAYNVIGNITIPHSPNDNMTIVSNRYDSMWSEAPGDSGAGAGIVLGIAKYFHDFNITPNCNLTFLFTTGEEWGMRGAWHYNHSHPEDEYNITRFIGTDQLGFNQTNSYFNPILSGGLETKKIMGVIANDTMYEDRTNYSFKAKSRSDFKGIDPFPFQGRSEECDTILIHKTANNPKWFGHHRAGMNFQEGDSMKYQNRTDLNVTFEYSWSIVKYYCVDPDCWYKNVDITVTDSDDEGTLVDTVTISYDVRSILPHDLAMNLNSLTKMISPTNDIVANETANFTINRSEISKSFSITLPSGESPGYYVFHNKIFNSTGRINEILNLYSNNHNQSTSTYSNFIFLYPYNYTGNPPVITNISAVPDPVGYGGSVTFSADVTSNTSSIDKVKVYIYKPSGAFSSNNMTNTGGSTYEYTFNDTWQHGMYNYTIWAEDANGNETGSSQYSFNVSAKATLSICTVQDEYGNNTCVNITDPPSNPPQVGYELLGDGEVLRIWNRLDSYYFDTNSGIQLTNHYDEYWSHNVLMLGYYNNDEWNLIYRTDELSGFNQDISSDDETFVNATLWKDLSYEGYDFRLAIRYHLGVDDNELTVIPYIKNLDDEDIPCILGFAWEIKDIQIDMTPENDYIEIDGATYYLNQSLDETYSNLDNTCFYIREDLSGGSSESLYLRWDEDLNYKVKVESRDGQYNAPVTLGIKIGTLDVGQEKQTSLFWHDASESVYYFNNYFNPVAWATNPGNMVDGNPSNSASTTIGGDIELCNSNNCSGTDLGTISKVELRTAAYYTGSQRDTILRPSFPTTGAGSEYRYQTPPGPSGGPCWSPWFDITNDPAVPGNWDWDDVQIMDCDVEAGTGGLSFTLYCSQVEIRVTYTLYTPPEISNPVPIDGSTGVSLTPTLNITVSDPGGDSMNITWLSNNSGSSWVAFGTNNSVGNGTYHQTMSNASVNGQWWYWKVNVSDGTSYNVSSAFKFYTGYQSKIENTGSTNFSGNLLIQVQFYNETSESWVVANDTVNETFTRTINAGSQFGLDTVFNGNVNTSDLIGSYGNGTYRVYACFRDPDGDVLVCDDETLMEYNYEFMVSEN